MEFQVKSLGKAARHRRWELLLTLSHGKSSSNLQSTVTSGNFFLTVLGITFFPFLNHHTLMSVNLCCLCTLANQTRSKPQDQRHLHAMCALGASLSGGQGQGTGGSLPCETLLCLIKKQNSKTQISLGQILKKLKAD